MTRLDVGYWHLADIAARPPDVRCRGVKLTSVFKGLMFANDPKRTSSNRADNRCSPFHVPSRHGETSIQRGPEPLGMGCLPVRRRVRGVSLVRLSANRRPT